MFLALVPVYNEEKTIGSVARSLFGRVDQVVVIDDGSEDATAQEGEAAGAIVLRHEINRGQGAALETGHEYARRVGADFVLHFDGDGQFDVADIAPSLQALKESQADVLLGSRFLKKSVIGDRKSENQEPTLAVPIFKFRIILPLARLFHCVFYRVYLTDAHNGFRILNRRALEHIRITHDRMAHATELVAQAHRAGLRIIEFPVRIVYREYGHGVTEGFVILRDLCVGKFVRRAK